MKECIFSVSFAGITFHINSPKPIEITKHFQPFIHLQKEAVEYEVAFRQVSRLPLVVGKEVASLLEYQIVQTEEGLVQIFVDALHDNSPYAVTRYDWENRRIHVQYLQGKECFFSDTKNSFFHTGWERVFLKENRMILHASCVDTPYGGLMFTGPSGIGKSTQSDLWCEHMDGRLINGDRPVLTKDNGIWMAYGSPYAGSSKCHVNENCTVRAIIVLEQANRCEVKRMKANEAFSKLYAGVTVQNWDSECVNAVSNLIMDLLAEIPVYQLWCTPDVKAVDILKSLLEEENVHGA